MPRTIPLAAVFFAALLTAQSPPAEKTFEGYWRGLIDFGTTRVQVGLDLTRAGETYVASADDYSKSDFGIPITFLVVMDRDIHLEHPSYKSIFDGKLSPDGMEIAGTLHYGRNFAVRLRRAPRPPMLVSRMARPQEPTGPLPYAVDGVSFPGAAGEGRLRGTLAAPPGPGPFPAAVLVNMAGVLDRDETIAGHKPFLVLSDYLARRGVATLRVDNRRAFGAGVGSLGQIDSFEQMAADARAALEYLKKQKNIDPLRTGLIGHGEGGLAAAAAASEGKAAFLILLAASGLPSGRLEALRSESALRAAGATPELIEWYSAWLQRLLEIVSSEPDPNAAKAKLAEATRRIAEKRPEKSGLLVSPGDMEATMERLNGAGFRDWMKRDPSAVLSRVKIPVLALGGSHDVETPPKDNLPAIFAALSQAGNPEFEVKELAGLNHLFQLCSACTITEYKTISETISPVALRAMEDWLKRVASSFVHAPAKSAH